MLYSAGFTLISQLTKEQLVKLRHSLFTVKCTKYNVFYAKKNCRVEFHVLAECLFGRYLSEFVAKEKAQGWLLFFIPEPTKPAPKLINCPLSSHSSILLLHLATGVSFPFVSP